MVNEIAIRTAVHEVLKDIEIRLAAGNYWSLYERSVMVSQAIVPLLGDDDARFVTHLSDTSKGVEKPLRSKSVRAKIVHLVRYSIDGMTDDELEVRMKRPHTTISAARNHLVRLGYLVDSGRRRNTRGGNPATLWVWTGKTRPPKEGTQHAEDR